MIVYEKIKAYWISMIFCLSWNLCICSFKKLWIWVFSIQMAYTCSIWLYDYCVVVMLNFSTLSYVAGMFLVYHLVAYTFDWMVCRIISYTKYVFHKANFDFKLFILLTTKRVRHTQHSLVVCLVCMTPWRSLCPSSSIF